MNTALQLFTQQGFANTPIEQLCRESKVTTRYFYQLFGSKEALITAVFDAVIADTAEQVVTAMMAARCKPPLDRFHAGAAAFYHAYLDDPRRAQIVLIEALGISAELERHRRQALYRFVHLIQSELQQQVRDSQLPAMPSRLQVVALVGALNELAMDWLGREDKLPIPQLIAEAASLIAVYMAGFLAQHPDWRAAPLDDHARG